MVRPGRYLIIWGNEDDAVEITELDVKYMQGLINKDLRYIRSRSANRKGNGADANKSKIQSRQRLLNQLARLSEKGTDAMMNRDWDNKLWERLRAGPPMTAVEIMDFVGYTTTTVNGLQHASDAVTRVRAKVKLLSHRSLNPGGRGYTWTYTLAEGDDNA